MSSARQRLTRTRKAHAKGPDPQPVVIQSAARDRDRVDLLLVARESDRYDRTLMLAMVKQTLAPMLHVPGVREAYDAGLAPLEDPGRFNAELIKYSGTIAVLFEICGTRFIYSMGSAAKGTRELDGDNAFAHILGEVVRSLRPKVVRTATFSRLVRSQDHAGRLLTAFDGNVDRVDCTDVVIDPSTQQGRMQWGFYATFAEMERLAIGGRTLAGRLVRLTRGVVPWGEFGVPCGYRMRDDGTVEVDDRPEVLAGVPEVLRRMADANATYKEIKALAGDLGLSTPRLRKKHGESATYHHARSAGGMVETWSDWLDLYRTGRVQVLLENPLKGVDEIAGVQVVPVPEAAGLDVFDHGAFRFNLEWGLPPGGWVEDHWFDAIRARLKLFDSGPRARGASSYVMCRPLAGLGGWTEGGRDYRLFTHDRYAVRSKPSEEGWDGQWWPQSTPGDRRELRIDPPALHALADDVMKAIAEGVPLQRFERRVVRYSPDGKVVVGPVEVPAAERLGRELEAAQAEYDAAIAMSVEFRAGGHTGIADDYRATVVACKQRIDGIARQLRAALRERPGTLPTTMPADVTQLVTAMAHLADAGTTADGLLNRRLKDLLTDLRVTMSDDGVTVVWSVSVRLPVEGGVAVFGPITGTVRNQIVQTSDGGKRRTVMVAPNGDEHLKRLALRILREGMRDEDIAGETGWERPRKGAVRCLQALGVKNARSASMLVQTPLQVLRDTAASLLTGDPLPDDATPEWAALVRGTYLSDDPAWPCVTWVKDRSRGQAAVDLIDAAGGEMPYHDLFRALVAAGVSRDHPRELWLGSKRPDTAFVPPVIELQGKPRAHSSVVRVRPCPHSDCDGRLNRCLHLPEIPGALLCPACRRTPSDPLVVFPAEYLTLNATGGPRDTPARPRPRITRDDVRRAVPDGPFTKSDLCAASGASHATVRIVVDEDLEAGRLRYVGEKETRTRGCGPSLYERTPGVRSREVRPARARVSREQVRRAIPDGDFTGTWLVRATGACPATVRRVVREELEAGRIAAAGRVGTDRTRGRTMSFRRTRPDQTRTPRRHGPHIGRADGEPNDKEGTSAR